MNWLVGWLVVIGCALIWLAIGRYLVWRAARPALTDVARGFASTMVRGLRPSGVAVCEDCQFLDKQATGALYTSREHPGYLCLATVGIEHSPGLNYVTGRMRPGPVTLCEVRNNDGKCRYFRVKEDL